MLARRSGSPPDVSASHSRQDCRSAADVVIPLSQRLIVPGSTGEVLSAVVRVIMRCGLAVRGHLARPRTRKA
jgi:hypothetical protein